MNFSTFSLKNFNHTCIFSLQLKKFAKKFDLKLQCFSDFLRNQERPSRGYPLSSPLEERNAGKIQAGASASFGNKSTTKNLAKFNLMFCLFFLNMPMRIFHKMQVKF